MFVLLGKTLIGENYHTWVVGASDIKSDLITRKNKIENLLLKYNCLISYKGPLIEKANVFYRDSLIIREKLNTSMLDPACDFISCEGITYVIVEAEKIKD